MGSVSFETICPSIIACVIGFLVYGLHHLPPFGDFTCTFLGIECPIPNSQEISLTSNKHQLTNILKSWVEKGFLTGAQVSIFVNNDEIFNFFVANELELPKFDDNSLVPVFSCTKNFAAIMIAIAIKNGWINSYDDKITDYWPEFPTRRIITKYEYFDKYYTRFSSNKTILHDYDHFIWFLETEKYSFNTDTFDASISDVLRHDSGMRLLLSKDLVYFDTITHDGMKKIIEDNKYLIEFEETQRQYHSLAYGYILSQLFINVEPKHRSILQYWDDEILPHLKDDSVVFELLGLADKPELQNKMYQIERKFNSYLNHKNLQCTTYHVIAIQIVIVLLALHFECFLFRFLKC